MLVSYYVKPRNILLKNVDTKEVPVQVAIGISTECPILMKS